MDGGQFQLGFDILQSDPDLTNAGSLSVYKLHTSRDKADTYRGINIVYVSLRQSLDIAGANISTYRPAAGEKVFTSLRWSLGRLQKIGASDWPLLLEAQG